MIEPPAYLFKIGGNDGLTVVYAQRNTVEKAKDGTVVCAWTVDLDDRHAFDNIRQARECAALLGKNVHAVPGTDPAHTAPEPAPEPAPREHTRHSDEREYWWNKL